MNKLQKTSKTNTGDNMKISWIKYEKDDKNYKLPEKLGFDVFKLNNPEDTDKKLDELIQNKYNTIFITNEIAGFSGNIINKYNKDDKVRIIITKDKE